MAPNDVSPRPESMLPIGPDRTPAALIHADPAAVSAAEMAKSKIQLAYFMATQQPRNERAAWQKILDSCRRPSFAKAAIYRKPVGGKNLEGPSIRLAEEIIRQWRNIMVLSQVVFEDDHARRVSVQVIDLEANNQFVKEIVIAKTVERKNATDREVIGERLNTAGERVYIVKSTEDEMQNKEAALISKAIRNEGLRLIPQDVVEDALTIARETRSDTTAKDPARAVKEIVFWLNARRIPVAEVERYIDCPMDQATAAQLDELVSICQAIDDGETTWRAVLEQKASADPGQQAKTATEARAAGLKQEIGKAKGAGTGAGAPAGATGGKGERPAEPSTAKPATQPRTAPAAASDGDQRPEPPAPGDDHEPQARPQPAAAPLAEDPQRQFDRVGYAVSDLVDLSVEALIAHANRVRAMMDNGEKRTARVAITGGNVEGLIAVLRRVAEREAGKP